MGKRPRAGAQPAVPAESDQPAPEGESGPGCSPDAEAAPGEPGGRGRGPRSESEKRRRAEKGEYESRKLLRLADNMIAINKSSPEAQAWTANKFSLAVTRDCWLVITGVVSSGCTTAGLHPAAPLGRCRSGRIYKARAAGFSWRNGLPSQDIFETRDLASCKALLAFGFPIFP